MNVPTLQALSGFHYVSTFKELDGSVCCFLDDHKGGIQSMKELHYHEVASKPFYISRRIRVIGCR